MKMMSPPYGEKEKDMKKLFIIDGASGTGKSEFISYVDEKIPASARVLQKITTREQRYENEFKKKDLRFVSAEEFETIKNRGALYDYTYGKLSDRKTAARYGIMKQDLDASIDRYEFTCVIVRNSDLTNKLSEIYEEKAHVVKIFVYSDENKIRERMEADHYSPEAIEYRSDRIKETWNDYVVNFNPMPNTHVLINNGVKNEYHQLIQKLFDAYSDKNEDPTRLFIDPNAVFPLMQPLVGFKKNLLKILKNYEYHKNVFVMMRFRDENETIFNSSRDVLKRHGFNCMRSDKPPLEHTFKNF
jgi:guanylate kinase